MHPLCRLDSLPAYYTALQLQQSQAQSQEIQKTRHLGNQALGRPSNLHLATIGLASLAAAAIILATTSSSEKSIPISIFLFSISFFSAIALRINTSNHLEKFAVLANSETDSSDSIEEVLIDSYLNRSSEISSSYSPAEELTE